MNTEKFNRLWKPGTPVMIVTGHVGGDYVITGSKTSGFAENGRVRVVGFQNKIKLNDVKPLVKGWLHG